MAETYLRKKMLLLKGQKNLCSEILTELQKVSNKISERFELEKGKNRQKINLQDLIEKHLSKLNPADVELNLRRAKLREAKRFKKELERKLGHITESIDNLNSIDDLPSKAHKLNLLDSQLRHEYFEEEKNKARSVQIKTKEYRQQQKAHQGKMTKHIEELEQEIQREKLLKQEQRKKELLEKDHEYKENLRKMHENKVKREKELEELKQHDKILKKVRNTKPMFVKISEQYLKEIEMPEFEKRKADLSKKRMMSSISTKQITEHAKWYETLKHERQQKFQQELKTKLIDRKIQSSDTTFTIWKQKLIEEEKQLKEERKKANEDRLKALEKRKTYGNLVKEMHLPSIDSSKRDEIEKRKMKLAASMKDLKLRPELNDPSHKSISEKSSWAPHKFKENPLVPKPVEKSMKKTVDYLGEMRKVREEAEKENKEEDEDIVEFKWDESLQNLPEAERIKVIQKQSRKIEKALKKKELALSSTSEAGKTLKYNDDINEMLISSIKTKISILEKTGN